MKFISVEEAFKWWIENIYKSLPPDEKKESIRLHGEIILTRIEEAFGWFLENVYKNLSAHEKRGELTNAWRNYTHKLGISPKKMEGILKRYGFEVKLLVCYKA